MIKDFNPNGNETDKSSSLVSLDNLLGELIVIHGNTGIFSLLRSKELNVDFSYFNALVDQAMKDQVLSKRSED